MKNFNILVDMNFLCYRVMHVSKGFSKRTSPYLSSKQEQEQFVRKISTDFLHDINLFKGYNKIIVVRDSHSWRKEYYTKYKAHREQKSDINWTKMFELMDEFLELLKKQGVLTSVIDGAEGDDLLYLWSEYLNDNLESNIILTGDADLTQLVTFDTKRKIFTAVYNNNSLNKKLVVKKGFTEWINSLQPQHEYSIFNMDDNILLGEDTLSVVKRLTTSLPVVEIDPASVILNKVLCGDDSDNVAAVWSWLKNDKPYRVTDRYYNKIYETLMEQYDEINIIDMLYNNELKNTIKKHIETIGKIEVDSIEFNRNLDRNIKLVYLNREMIPYKISDKFFEYVKDLKPNEVTTKTFSKSELLKDTRYETTGYDNSFIAHSLF